MISHSDLLSHGLPASVQVFANGLAKELGLESFFWIRTWERPCRAWYRPAERFVIVCMIHRLQCRYLWNRTDVARVFGIARQTTVGAHYRRAEALFTLYPDLGHAVRRLDGERAAAFILEQWDEPIRMVLGKSIRAAG
jgi:hypothetical protein